MKLTAHYVTGAKEALDLGYHDFKELWQTGRWNQKDIQRVEFENNTGIDFRPPATLTPL